MTDHTFSEGPAELNQATVAVRSPYLDWSAIFAGALIASALSFVLISFGAALGLSVLSPSSTWRDTSAVVALVAGLWLLLTALASFGLGAYLTGCLRSSRLGASEHSEHEVDFRDGAHGLTVWALAVILAGALALALAKPAAGATDATRPAAAAEPLIAFELDRLFRSDRTPVDPANDPELRAQAARIITAGLGHAGAAPEDRAYLVHLVQTRTGLAQADAETRVNQTVAQAGEALSRARRGAVLTGFLIAASLMVGAAVAWLAATAGGQHRDMAVSHSFWRRWEVDRFFVIR